MKPNSSTTVENRQSQPSAGGAFEKYEGEELQECAVSPFSTEGFSAIMGSLEKLANSSQALPDSTKQTKSMLSSEAKELLKNFPPVRKRKRTKTHSKPKLPKSNPRTGKAPSPKPFDAEKIWVLGIITEMAKISQEYGGAVTAYYQPKINKVVNDLKSRARDMVTKDLLDMGSTTISPRQKVKTLKAWVKVMNTLGFVDFLGDLNRHMLKWGCKADAVLLKHFENNPELCAGDLARILRRAVELIRENGINDGGYERYFYTKRATDVEKLVRFWGLIRLERDNNGHSKIFPD